MDFILKLAGLAFMLLLVPLCLGGFYSMLWRRYENDLFHIYVLGYSLHLFIFLCLIIPAILYDVDFIDFVFFYKYLMIAVCFLSILFARKHIRGLIMESWKILNKIDVLIIITAILIVIQSIITSLAATPNIQDNTLETVVTTLNTNTVMKYNPYTGGRFEEVSLKMIFSCFPVYYAVISSISNVSPYILIYNIVPLIHIGISYMIYAFIGWELFENKRKVCYFIQGIILISLFSAYSEYSIPLKFLIQPWDENILYISTVYPIIFYLMLILTKEKASLKEILVFVFLLLLIALLVSPGTFILSLILILTLVLFIVGRRGWRNG